MKIFGVILCEGGNDVFSIDCDYSLSRIGSEESFSVTALCDIPNNPLTFSQNTFFNFWKEYYNENTYFYIHMNTIHVSTPANSIPSISLSVFMAPILCLDDFSTSYTHICFSGTVGADGKTGGIGMVEKKHQAFSDYLKTKNLIENENNSFIFVYVSETEISVKDKNFAIQTLRIPPKSSVLDILYILSSSFSRRKEKYIEFNNATFTKFLSIFETNNDKNFKAQIYLSGNDTSKDFFDFKWFDIFRLAIAKGYKFCLTINISKFLSNTEITSDDMKSNLQPKWWKSDISDTRMITINERLKRLDLFIRNQIEVFKRYVYETYGYTDLKNKITGRLNISVNYCDNAEINLSEEESTENAFLITVNHYKYISYSNAGYFKYEQYNENDTLPSHIQKIINSMVPMNKPSQSKFISYDDIRNIVDADDLSISEKLKNIGTRLRELKSEGKYLPRFTIYGFPGTGKTTILKRIAEIYKGSNSAERISVNDIHLISSDFIINERLFDDNKNSRHNPNEGAKNRDNNAIKECVIYSRNDYEEFMSDGEHDMEIRNLAVEIAIRQSCVTHDLLDLGAKEILIENTRHLLNELGFITVFLCPDGNPENPPIVFNSDNEKINVNDYFDVYYDFFKNNFNLFDKMKRRNICKLGEPFITRDNGMIAPEDWDKFKKNLREKIFNPRFHLYNRKFDIKVYRRGSVDISVYNILKSILLVHDQWLQWEREC